MAEPAGPRAPVAYRRTAREPRLAASAGGRRPRPAVRLKRIRSLSPRLDIGLAVATQYERQRADYGVVTERRQSVSVLLIAAGLFIAITAWRFADPAPATGITFLYVVPISLLAAGFGFRGGIPGAAVASGLFAWWGTSNDVVLSSGGYLVRAAAFFAVALVVGWQVQRRKALEGEADRWFSISDDMCCVANFDGYFTRVNAAWSRWLGYSEEELLDQPFVAFVHPDDVERTVSETAALAGGPHATINFENRYRAKSGRWHWLSWSARSDGKCIYAAARDLTVRKELEAQLRALATEDKLTGVANRRAWDTRVEDEIRRAARAQWTLTIAMIDIDNLKTVNDTQGHAAGDRLLIACATAWSDAIRDSDFLARLGGDEFGLLLPDCDASAAGVVIERLRAATPAGIQFSAGIAERGNATAEVWTQRADEALYRAKSDGRDLTVAASC